MMLVQTLPPLYSPGLIRQLTGFTWQYLTCIARDAGRMYQPFDIRQVGTEKWRHIDNPRTELKTVQQHLLQGILREAILPSNFFGAAKGRDVLDHARIHVGEPTIVALDLRDCFPRTHDEKVFRVFRRIFGCSAKVAAVFTRLTTYQHRLPQGAPTSPYLAQLVMVDMMRDIEAITSRRGLRYSIYVDDLVISGRGAQHALGEILAVIVNHGHRIRHKKKRIMTAGQDEVVVTGTGIGATSLRCPSEYEARLVARIRQRANETTITEAEMRSISGQLAHVKRLDPELALTLSELKYLLPQVLGEGKPERASETRPCRRASRHRYSPRSDAGP